MKNFFFLLFFIMSFSVTFAQSSKVEVKGTLYDDDSGEPLEFGTVSLYTPGDSALVAGAITGPNGNYTLAADPGKYYLVAQFVSYQDKVLSNVVIPEGRKTYTITGINLSQDVETLSEVVVKGSKQQMEMLLDKRVFNVGEDVSNAGRSASEILDRVPSVAVDQEGNVSLRGSSNVRILIDGKPSGLVGLSSSDGLRLLQGNLVEKVEVITNPSARYQAEGQAGIINIVLKKERQQGFNGAVSLNTGYPSDHGISANLNYRAKNMNIFANYGISYRRQPGEGMERRTQFNDDSISYLNTDSDFLRGGLSNNIQIGAEYFFNDKTVLTGSFLYRHSDEDNNRDTQYRYLDTNGELQLQTLREDNETETDFNREYSLMFRKQFDLEKQEFNFDVQYRDNSDIEKSDINEDLIFGDAPPTLIQRTDNKEGEQNFLIETFYSHPVFNDGIFEIGLRSNYRKVGNDYILEEENENGIFEPIYEFSNDFRYDEFVQAGYVLLGNTKNRWSWQAGLRGEYTEIETDLRPLDPELEDQVNNKNYFNLFPSASVSYKLAGENNLQASYSRRVSRPWFRMLNPFSSYSDRLSIRTGNPDLDPSYTDSYEVGYLLNWPSGSLYSSLYYRKTTGEWERITTSADENGVTYSFPVNLSVENATGFEFNYSQDLAEWWTINANANLYYSETDGMYEETRYYAEAFSASGRVNSKMTIWDKVYFQMNYRYRAPRKTTQGERKSFNSLDVGLSTDVLKGKGTVVFNVNDVLNTGIYRGTTETDNFYSESEYRRRFRQFTLNFTYRINRNPERERKERDERDGNDRNGEEMDNDFKRGR